MNELISPNHPGKKFLTNNRREILLFMLFTAPLVLLVAAVTFLPIATAIKWSLYETKYVQMIKFIGLENFRSILSSQEGWQAIFVSVFYVFASLLTVVPLGICIGALLNQKLRCRALLRTVIIVPWVLSQTITGLLWKWLLNSNYGPVVYIISSLTGNSVDFLNGVWAARLSLILANLWNTLPISIILTLAAMQTISRDVYEAAMVDGSTGLHAFFHITLPLIKPTVAMMIVMQSMEYFNMVTLMLVLTGGGPFGSTTTLSLMAYKQGFAFWRIGEGTAYSIIIFMLNILFSLVYIKLLSRKEA